MTPTDLTTHLRAETEVKLDVFVNYDENNANYLVLTENGVKHKFSIRLDRHYSTSLNWRLNDLVTEIVNAERFVENTKKAENYTRTVKTMQSQKLAGLSAALEALDNGN